MPGQLRDAGNTTTPAHYLDLLAGAGMLCGLPKFSVEVVRQRGSSPKFQVLNNALITSQSAISFIEARRDPERWGRILNLRLGPIWATERRWASTSFSSGARFRRR
jgi:uncharacterized protein